MRGYVGLGFGGLVVPGLGSGLAVSDYSSMSLIMSIVLLTLEVSFAQVEEAGLDEVLYVGSLGGNGETQPVEEVASKEAVHQMGVPAAYLDPESMGLEEDPTDHTDQTRADRTTWEDDQGHTPLGGDKSVPGVSQLDIPL